MTTEEARLLLAQREFDEAAREWAAARLLAEQRFFRQAVPRVYFAAFHAAQGLLAAHGIEATTHEGVQRLIGLHFVLPGLLPKEAGRALSALLARRHEANYRLLVEVDESAWTAACADGRAFIDEVVAFLERTAPQLSLRIEPTAP